jgi:hypothetical protein
VWCPFPSTSRDSEWGTLQESPSERGKVPIFPENENPLAQTSKYKPQTSHRIFCLTLEAWNMPTSRAVGNPSAHQPDWKLPITPAHRTPVHKRLAHSCSEVFVSTDDIWGKKMLIYPDLHAPTQTIQNTPEHWHKSSHTCAPTTAHTNAQLLAHPALFSECAHTHTHTHTHAHTHTHIWSAMGKMNSQEFPWLLAC